MPSQSFQLCKLIVQYKECNVDPNYRVDTDYEASSELPQSITIVHLFQSYTVQPFFGSNKVVKTRKIKFFNTKRDHMPSAT